MAVRLHIKCKILDSTFWLDSTLKLKLWCKNPVEVVLEVKSLALALKVKSLALALALRVKSLALALALRVKSLALALALRVTSLALALRVKSLLTTLQTCDKIKMS